MWYQWIKLHRIANSRFSGHTTVTVWVQCFSGAKSFHDNEKKWVLIGVVDCGESKYDVYFWIGPFLFYIFFPKLGKNGKSRQKNGASLSHNTWRVTRKIDPWLCREIEYSPGECKTKCLNESLPSSSITNCDLIIFMKTWKERLQHKIILMFCLLVSYILLTYPWCLLWILGEVSLHFHRSRIYQHRPSYYCKCDIALS